ncbi:MAG: hypothetical protein B7Z62_08880 [Deltaproteobacteria bacterium 37-65-8]|nr:MAG: hypothetical protein B7X01_03790 [Acidiphilium sp. 21-62-4]OYV96077.1 MAG: hypothetical protein B7Z62_08880 [Deltaproteobacteria bacterium 37-65-8]
MAKDQGSAPAEKPAPVFVLRKSFALIDGHRHTHFSAGHEFVPGADNEIITKLCQRGALLDFKG